MEGPKGEVILLWFRSNLERSKLFSCRNRLLRHNVQVGIESVGWVKNLWSEEYDFLPR